MVSVTHQPLYPRGMSRSYHLNRRLVLPQRRCGRFGKEKRLFPLSGIEPRICQPVAWAVHICAVTPPDGDGNGLQRSAADAEAVL